jgi:hypothetical protein
MSTKPRRKEPIRFFKDDTQFQECVAYWKHLLYLDDWAIKAKLVVELIDDDGMLLAGNNDFSIMHKTCSISVTNEHDTENDILKCCAEKTLVHELLHCHYNWLGNKDSDYAGAYFSVLDHQRLEFMARSLVCAKYGLDTSWFTKVEENQVVARRKT